jgi:two-component system sensor histidine kinase HydH
MLTVRERVNKRLYLEYEVYKTLTALTDLARTQELGEDDKKNVVGFGIYSAEGNPLTLYGKAPASMMNIDHLAAASSFSLGDASVVIIRTLGGDLPGRRMMMGTDRSGRLRNQGAMGETGIPGNAVQGFAGTVPAIAYLEYSTGGFKAEEAMLVVAAVIITLTLIGLYAVLMVMYRRYLVARDRETKNRELVELGQAARTIAHEIKNPLGVIRIQCGILRRSADESTAAGLSVIDSEALRLAELVDRIRTYLKSGDHDVNEVSARVFVERFSVRYRDVIDVDLGVEEGIIICVDESRITAALDNIISNAIEASAQVSDRPLLSVQLKQHKFVCSVSDRGPGIPARDVQRIFEPFYTTKERGSGLGLALARKNIEASNGTLEYSDRPGGGAVFTVTFSLASRIESN